MYIPKIGIATICSYGLCSVHHKTKANTTETFGQHDSIILHSNIKLPSSIGSV